MRKYTLYFTLLAILVAPIVIWLVQQALAPQPAAQTASPTPTQTTSINISSLEPATEAEVDQAEISLSEFGAAAKAVDLIAAWVEAGAPETEAFNYTGIDGNTYPATFEVDILPLFTENGVWFEGAQACAGCHFGNSEASYHEMSLASYEGLMKGGDVLSSPPGTPILGQSKVGAADFNFDVSRLRTRLRNNRMPPGWPFDITETNRNGPCVQVSPEGVTLALDADGKITYGCELNAVGVIEAWVNAGAPENETFEYGSEQLTFARDVQPFFTQPNMWFEGSQACSGCHFGNTENSYHEMDLSTYEGILKGGDVLSSPPGTPILGQSQVGASDFDFEHSRLRERLRNNRMPPGIEFDITEENRDGPLVLHGKRIETKEEKETLFGSGQCQVKAVNLLAAWVEAGAPKDGEFPFSAENGDACAGTFEVDILPLFTENGVWFEGAQACAGCHFGNSEASYHEMSLASYDGLMKGGDVLSSPPGTPILGQSKVGAADFNFDVSRLRTRLRNNRMPPGWPFDITETNRNGPCVQVSPEGVTLALDADGKITYGCELNAVGVIEAWVNAGAPENEPFEYGSEQLTFARDVQPFFTQPNMWFEGSQACSGCHFGNTENSYHEMDLSTYEGILKGGDVLSSPPGTPILGQSQVGKSDFDFEHSRLRERLRNNRMPPGIEFDITEENRDGPIVLAGVKK